MLSNAPWALCLLDQFRLARDGAVVARFYDRKPDRVLAYIALHRDRPIPRVELATALWPDRDPTLARNRLSESLHYVRRDLVAAGAPGDCISGNRHVVTLNPDINTDVRLFEDAVARAVANSSPERQNELLERALTIYGDGLLPGMGGDWVAVERERLRAVHAMVARQLTRSLSEAGAFEATPEFTEHLAPEDLARQWVRSRSLELATPPLAPSPRDVSEPWIPGKSLDALERRLANRAVATVEQAEPHLWGPERAEWLAILDDDYDDIMAALRWAIDAKEPETALALSSAMWPYWDARGKVAEGRELAESALALEALGTSVRDAKAVHGAGVLALISGDLGAAETRLLRARDLWVEHDEFTWLARSLVNLSIIAYRRREHSVARDLVGQAIGILRGRGSNVVLIRALKDAALVEIADEQYDDAEENLNEALDLSRRDANVSGEGKIVSNLATVAQCRERWEDAKRLSETALGMLSAEGDLAGVAFCLRSLGKTYTAAGDYESAERYLDDSIRLAKLLDDDWAVGEATLYRGRLLALTGETEEALAAFHENLRLFEACEDAEGVAEASAEIAALVGT